MSPNAHPSYLELDRGFLADAADLPPALREHLTACPRCADYVGKLRADRTRLDRPAWLTQLARPAPVPVSRPALHQRRWSAQGARGRSRWRRAPAVLLASAAAALLLLILWPPRPGLPEDPGPLRTKGEPAVAVYVKRSDRVWLWDGLASLQRGDQLRLKIVAAGYAHVTVAAPDGKSSRLRLLYAGRLAGPETLLPTSWELDAQPEPEVLHVLLSPQPLSAQDLQSPAATSELPLTTRTAGAIWAKTLRLPKTAKDPHVP